MVRASVFNTTTCFPAVTKNEIRTRSLIFLSMSGFLNILITDFRRSGTMPSGDTAFPYGLPKEKTRNSIAVLVMDVKFIAGSFGVKNLFLLVYCISSLRFVFNPQK